MLAYNKIWSAFIYFEKAKKVEFFKKSFLIANISLKIGLKIGFFILNNININFLI